MKILVIAQYYPPDITAASYRIKETVGLLRSGGEEVRVVTARPHRAQVDGAASTSAEPSVVRAPIAPIRPGKLGYLLHYTSFMISAFFAALLRGGKADVVWASSPPLFVALSGWAVARLKRVPFVLDVRDIWPDSAVVAGQLSRSGFLFRWGKRVERWIYRRADAITCVARPMAEYISSYVPDKQVTVIYNGVPSALLRQAAEAAGDPDAPQAPLHVAYVGNFGFCQDLGLLLQAAKRAREDGIPLRFSLVGSGAERAKLEAQIQADGLSNVALYGPVSKDEAMAVVARASALFLQLKDDGTMEKTIPSKVFDYMVAGRPIVFGIEGEGRQILEESGGNLHFQPGSLDDLVGALKRLSSEWPELARNAQRNRARVTASFTRETLVQKLVGVFRSVVPGGATAVAGGGSTPGGTHTEIS